MVDLTTTERNGKIAIWVTPPKEDCLVGGNWNFGDISPNPSIEEVLKVAGHAYELGRKHQLNRISNYINNL